MRKIIILNYVLSCVDVVNVPADCDTTEKIESKLHEMGFSDSGISWMSTEEDSVPVFYGLDECPTYVL